MTILFRTFCGAAVVVFWSCCATSLSAQSASNSLLCESADGSLLACANRDSGSVSLIDAGAMERRFEVQVGRHPEGTTFIGRTSLVACCVYGEDAIVILDAKDGTTQHRIDVFDEPYGIVRPPR